MLSQLFSSIQSTLVVVGGSIIAISLMVLGIKAMVSFAKQGSIREVFSGLGVILLGAILIGGAVVLGGVFLEIGKNL